MKLRIATRKSALALAQTEYVAQRLKAIDPTLEIELLPMVTIGDRVLDRSLNEIGGKGLFVSEIEQRVLEGQADLAVHSLKDMPAELAEGLCLAAVPEREDPRDVLVSADGATLMDLEAGSKIGTNSVRRTLQLKRQRNDLHYAMLRGNVNTRLAKLDAGEYRAIVLAAAGLRRLNLADRPLVPLSIEESVPAVGQGALAIEARVDAPEVCALLKRIECATTRVCIEAERTFLRELGGDCNTPLAGHARLTQNQHLRFDGLVGSLDGSDVVRGGAGTYIEAQDDVLERAQQLGRQVAETVLAQGGADFIAQAKADVSKRLDPRKLT